MQAVFVLLVWTVKYMKGIVVSTGYAGKLGLAVARCLDQRSYSTPDPVSTWIGDRLWAVNHLGM